MFPFVKFTDSDWGDTPSNNILYGFFGYARIEKQIEERYDNETGEKYNWYVINGITYQGEEFSIYTSHDESHRDEVFEKLETLLKVVVI